MSAVPEGFKEYYHGPQDIPPEHRIFAYPEKAEPVPVSYTHLDVYKRQARGNTPIPSKRLPSLMSGIARGDVYKRQR